MTPDRPVPCEAGACVAVSITPTTVEVRDTKHADSPVLVYTHGQWQPIVAEAITGRMTCVAQLVDGGYAWGGHDADGQVRTLLFDEQEMTACAAACRAGAYRVPAHAAAGSVTA